MKISLSYPPNYAQMKEHFPTIEEHKPVFCYGDTIYNPFDIKILPDLEFHESIHSRQQGNLPEVWYASYFADKEFRLAQELEAYGEQYLFIKPHMKGKLLDWALDKFAEALSSSLYGNLCTYGQARSWIRQYGVV